MAGREADFGAVRIVRIAGANLDAATRRAVGRCIYQMLDEWDGGTLVLDCGEVQQLDSAVVEMLLNVRSDLLRSGVQLILCRLTPLFREVFEITKLDRLFRIEDRLPDPLPADIDIVPFPAARWE